MAFFEGGGGNGSVVRVNPARPQAAARAAYSPPAPRVVSQAPTLPPILHSAASPAPSTARTVAHTQTAGIAGRAQRAGTPTQRLAMLLALTRGQHIIPMQGAQPSGVWQGAADVTNKTMEGVWKLAMQFRPPPLVQGGNLGGMYDSRAYRMPDSLPPRASEIPTVPIQNVAKGFKFRGPGPNAGLRSRSLV